MPQALTQLNAQHAPMALDAGYTLHRHGSVLELLSALAPGATRKPVVDVFYSLQWLNNLEHHGIDGAGETVALRCERKHDPSPLAALVLRKQPAGAAALFGPVLGGLSNYYSSLFGPVPGPDALSVGACRAVARFLRRQGDLPAVIDLQPLDANGSFFRNWQQAMREQGFLVSAYFCFGNWYLEVGGRDFDSYYPSVPSRIRNTVRRARKRLDDNGTWSLRVFKGGEPDLEDGIADFDSVYRKSWKVPEPFPHFVPELMRTAAAEGWLRLGVLRIGDTPVAAQLWLVHARRALIYKLAYDEAYKRFSAGSVLTAELFRMAIDTDRVSEIDYLTGDDAYKADWMSHRRERLGLVAFDPRRLQGALSACRHYAAMQWKRWRPQQVRPAPVNKETNP